MKTIALYLIGALLCTAPAFARIGDTEAQIEARYGKAYRTDDKSLPWGTVKFFHAAGMSVTVTFIKGISGSEYFKKEETRLSDDEVEALLKVNCPAGKQWVRTNAIGIDQLWDLSDGLCHAKFAKIDGNLMIASQELLDINNRETKAEVAAKLKGF